jgi:hypothetical protein
LIYNSANPGQYLITNVSSTSPSCVLQNQNVAHTDMSGSFSYDITNGNTIQLSRAIEGNYYNTNNCTSVMKYINGQDALLAELISTQVNAYSGSPFRPNAFQMVSADVNTNDKVRSNDVTLIMQRSVKSICEFPQDWNYTLGNTANPIPPAGPVNRSYDWLFIDKYTFDHSADFVIDGAYPYTDPLLAAGYWRDDVPNVPLCIPVRTQNGTCPGPVNDVYYGMLLGDINGNWAAVAGENVRTATTDDKIIFDIANAENLGNGYYNIPVMYSMSVAMTSLDFNIGYDKNYVQILSVDKTPVSVNADMRSMHNNDPAGRLHFISYTLSNVNSIGAVFYISVYVPEGSLKSEYFSGAYAYLNGDEVKGEVTGAKSNTTTGTFTQGQYQQTFVIKPNPAKEDITVDYLFTEAGNNSVRINDMMGVTLGEYVANNVQGSVMISLNTLTPGIYYCQLIENGMVIANKKLVVTR